jgi:uncharacterized protein (TIGR00725 family)
MGSGRERHERLAAPLGAWLAAQGYHLLTGGGAGAMTAVSEAFHAVTPREGLVLGVLPGGPEDGRPPLEYPNPFVEVAIRTHLPHSGRRGLEPQSRNHINVLSSDVVIALPGGEGTRSELMLAMRYGIPVLAHLTERTQIPDLPDAIPVETELSRVQAFVIAQIERAAICR